MADALEQDPTVLRLDIGVDGPTLGHLIETQERFLGMIREVARELVGNASDVRWVVARIDADSLDLAVRAEPTRQSVPQALIRDLVGTVARGVRILERDAARPPHFNDAALAHAKELARLRGRGVTKLEVKSAEISATFTPRTMANIDDVLGRTVSAIGTVEGRLEALNVHGDRVFYVWDPIKGRVRCDFGYRIPSHEVGRAVELRVAVSGELHYRENGTLVDIRAEDLVLLEPPEGLPSADDVLGILAG